MGFMRKKLQFPVPPKYDLTTDPQDGKRPYRFCVDGIPMVVWLGAKLDDPLVRLMLAGEEHRGKRVTFDEPRQGWPKLDSIPEYHGK